MVHNRRTVETLKEASYHLFYEYWMLDSVVNALVSGTAKEEWLQNALIESFVIHLRSLIDFYYKDKPKPDDIVASDYFEEESTWGTIRPQSSDALDIAKKRANKELAHLTYERLNVTPKEKGWDFIHLAQEIKKLTYLFIKNVSRDKLHPNWYPLEGKT